MSNKEQELRDEIAAHLERYPHVKNQMTGGLLVRLLSAQQSPASDELTCRSIGNAEMKPYLYDGDKCDQVKPQWDSYMDGDMSGESGIEIINYPAVAYPPGTKITISVPCCPKCSEPSGINSDASGKYEISDCTCGFSWKDWTDKQYS